MTNVRHELVPYTAHQDDLDTLEDMLRSLREAETQGNQSRREMVAGYLLAFERRLRQAAWTSSAAKRAGLALARRAEEAADAAIWSREVQS